MKKSSFILLIIFLASLLFRMNLSNRPLWVDEFSSISQANLIIKHGFNVFTQKESYFEPNNILTHLLIASSFKIFEVSIFFARLPILLIGSLVPVLVFLVAKKLFNKNTAYGAAILSISSYFMIAWSQQARGYVLQQALLLLAIYLYVDISKAKNQSYFLLFIVLILGLLTHISYFLLLIAIILHFIFFILKEKDISRFLKIFKSPIFYFVLIFLLLMAKFTGQMEGMLLFLKNFLGHQTNNLWYYHSFLWREYSLISFLSVLGLILGFKNKEYFKSVLLFGLIIFIYLFFFCFVFGPYVSRYILPIFPLLLILSALAISSFATLINSKSSLFVSVLLTLVIVANGNKFNLIPSRYHSINHDMREAAVIDYDVIYQIIKEKTLNLDESVAIIDSWNDRTNWYLGENYGNQYFFRWIDEEGSVNGLSKKTPFEINEFGEKYVPNTGFNSVKLIGELSDLEKAMSKYSKGFIWIDDSSLPQDVQDYAKLNFKKELEIDSYGPELLENPYSKWPGILYSWGFDN